MVNSNDTPPTSSKVTPSSAGSASDFVTKLRNALRREGDFPASAKIVSELRELLADPKTTANQITEIILREPSLGTRVLHLVNSSFYRRAKPIMTVSQAVIQIGMRPLAELCAGLVLLQKFIPAARRGGPFATCLQKTIMTSLLSSSMTSALGSKGGSKNDETGYLAGSFSEIGTLLLAYYFPQVYETALKRSETKKQDLSRSITEIVGLSPWDLSAQVIDALDLPSFYKDVLTQATAVVSTAGPAAAPNSSTEKVAQAIYASQTISQALCDGKDQATIEGILLDVQKKVSIAAESLNKVVADLPEHFSQHCSSMELPLPPLPEFLSSLEADGVEGAAAPTESLPVSNGFNHYVEEIRQAVENQEPTASVITTVMETLAWGLKFDRVLLLLATSGKKKLVGRMLLGQVPDFDPKDVERPISVSAYQAPDVLAFLESHPVFRGESVLPDGWPLMAIPIGFGSRAIGVIYADRTAGGDDELNAHEQAAISVLAELLDRSITLGN